MNSFTGQVSTGCGRQPSAVGPFYCPADRQVYLDLGFFDELASRFDAPGDFAQAYVVAHEVGHHVQNLDGTSDQVRAREQAASSEEEANEWSVRLELQADCYAGVWAHSVDVRGPQEGSDVALEPATSTRAWPPPRPSATTASSPRRAWRSIPETWTHGSSEQRREWFTGATSPAIPPGATRSREVVGRRVGSHEPQKEESLAGVPLTNLDQALFDGAGATKRDLVDYLDGVRDRILPVLEDRPLSVIRVHRGQEAFMQKNVPKYTPDWVRTVSFWAETSKRDVSYALCNDRRTLLWFANQRAVEYHPTLVTVDRPDRVTHLVLDLDPPEGDSFPAGGAGRPPGAGPLDGLGLAGAVKTSGAKGVHVFVPIDTTPPLGGRGGRHPGHRRPGRAPRPRHRHHRVHEGGPRGQGLRRRHPGGRGHGDLGLQPPGAARRARVVPGGVGRPRRRVAPGLHRPHGPRHPGRRRPVGGRHAPPSRLRPT